MFLSRFLVSNLLCALFVGIILLVKKIFYEKLSVKYHYMIWFTLLFSLGAAFMPDSFFSCFHFLPDSFVPGRQDHSSRAVEAAQIMQGSNWMQDFSETDMVSLKLT